MSGYRIAKKTLGYPVNRYPDDITLARRPIKGSKEAEFHLVLWNKKNKEIVRWTFLSGPNDFIQKFLDPYPRMMYLSKNVMSKNPKTPKLFFTEAGRLSAFLEGFA